MGEKRKQVVFAADESVHPSRRVAVDGPAALGTANGEPKAPKVKTVAKQRYLKKKARKHKILVAARKASAPKTKQPGTQLDQSSGIVEIEDVDMEGSVAGPSTPRATAATNMPATTIGDGEENEEDEAAAKERRKRDKREKRANRNKEKPTSDTEQVTGASPAPGEVSEGDEDGRNTVEPSARSPTPPMLEAFPFPTSAPAPAASILSRQGLPAGLEDATFVDQDTRIAVDSLRDGNGESYLNEEMKKRLSSMGIKEFFAVQSAMLPPLLAEELDPDTVPSDYLVSAPTGSGKTLAYCIPLVKVLSTRRITRLRALIVLPTRELVTQVKEVLDSLSKGTNLKIAAISGQQSFAHEQAQLVPIRDQRLLGGSSNVDIIIATPGRLTDHITSTPNFSLQHLRFLIIDEADRLLHQSFQGWLNTVTSHIYPPVKPIKLDYPPRPWDIVAPAWMEAFGMVDLEYPYRDRPQSPKLLFSATLTRDPSKIAALSLRSPKYYIVQSASHPTGISSIGEQFAVPSGLTEKMIILPPALKPLNLIHLLYAFSVRNALIFTKSVEAAVRLEVLLTFYEEAWTGEKLVARSYTADMRPGERKKLLEDFGVGRVDLLICSDLVARGIDLPTTSHVVSYDVPLDMRKYVHRVGRTARAGRAGTAWTLVEKQEALRFKGWLKGAGHEKNVKKIKVKEEALEPYQESYKIAMERFSERYSTA